MRYRSAKTLEWQRTGGEFEIPDNWLVTKVDLDCEEPHAIIANGLMGDDKQVKIPKSLAYYLSTHHCGSKVMCELIREDTKQEMRQKIKEVLGL